MSSNPKPTRSPQIPQSARFPRSPPISHSEDAPRPQDAPPETDPSEDAAYEGEPEDEIPYPEPSSEQTLLPPPNFNPFFTLIEDSTTGEHYHPYVHYVFADDDPVIVTAAAMRSLGLDDTQYLPQNTPEGEEKEPNQADEQETQVESPLPPPIPGIKEHYLIVDVGTDGHTIVDAQSLSSEWQITDANIRTAPSFDESSPDHSYMLRIEGVEVPGRSKGKTKGEPGDTKLREARERSQGDLFGALDELVKGVEGNQEVAGKIAGTS
ncbi:hypothetical protein BDV95DRAFT_450884, partial [Massariosphaeria phaeospora]